MLQTGAILLLESAINKIINSDQVTAQSLSKLSGKVFQFVVSDAPISFYLLPYENGIQLQRQHMADADTVFQGSLQNFKNLATTEDKSSQFFGNGIQISGDSQLATQLQKIIANADIDWQGLTAQFTGDLLAHQLANILKASSRQLKITQQSLTLNIAEYLQEEIHTLPARAEVEGFIIEVDDAQQSTQRLEARLDLLEDNLQRQVANKI